MTPAFVVQITTPEKVHLNGLWFGPKKPKRLIVMVHGLTGSAFSMNRTVSSLINTSTAVLTFNSRGFGIMNSIKQGSGTKKSYISAGTAHEVFTDCVDDIQGAIDFARKARVREVYLAGHSTGCQKIVYWASKKKDRSVKGLILLGPLSDYSGAVSTKTKKVLERGVMHAKKLIQMGRPHELMPAKFAEWFECDAQRYVSLYSPDSPEEVFTYARPEVVPATLGRTVLPFLVFLAAADEYGDLPAKTIATWFDKQLKGKSKIFVIPNIGHSFKGGETAVAKAVAVFMKER